MSAHVRACAKLCSQFHTCPHMREWKYVVCPHVCTYLLKFSSARSVIAKVLQYQFLLERLQLKEYVLLSIWLVKVSLENACVTKGHYWPQQNLDARNAEVMLSKLLTVFEAKFTNISLNSGWFEFFRVRFRSIYLKIIWSSSPLISIKINLLRKIQ